LGDFGSLRILYGPALELCFTTQVFFLVSQRKEKTMNPITVDADLVAVCGLYCGACRSHRKGKCPGCRKNTKATWCKARTCSNENHFSGCSDCCRYSDPGKECRKLNNPISWIFSVLFNSNRSMNLKRIREVGREVYAKEMAEAGRMSLPRKK
jgi:hypothetical protein